MKIIKDTYPSIAKEKIYRLLGYRENKRLSGRLIRRTEEFIGHAYQIIKPRVVYTTRKIEKIEDGSLTIEGGKAIKSSHISKSLRKCNSVTVFLATVGEKMDDVVHTLMKQKKMTDASIYDAIGSVAVEETVENFHRRFDSDVEERNEKTTLRFSPGYCDWQIQEQRKIFQIVEGDMVGVRLNSECLMIPEKSVSGIFGVGQIEEIDRSTVNPCGLCGMHRCIARRA